MNRLLLNNPSEVPPGRFRYFQTETRTNIGPHGTLRALLDAVRIHRTSNRLDIPDDLDKEVQDWMCQNMRSSGYYCHEEGERIEKRIDGSAEEATGWDGSAMWAELHRYALFQTPSPTERLMWLIDFSDHVPCGTCRRHWKNQVRAHPLPKDATPEEFFAWTVSAHSAISRSIGKVELDVDKAREVWSK